MNVTLRIMLVVKGQTNYPKTLCSKQIDVSLDTTIDDLGSLAEKYYQDVLADNEWMKKADCWPHFTIR